MKRITISLNKVQYAIFYYRNQVGKCCRVLPKKPSVHGKHLPKEELAAYHCLYPGETLRERAMRLDLIDRWTPIVEFQFAANHSVRFTGKKAQDMWKAWQSFIFKKK